MAARSSARLRARARWVLAVRSFSLASVVVVAACAARTLGPSLQDRGVLIQRRYGAQQGRVFSNAAAALTQLGYVIAARDSSDTTGFLRVAPRFTWDSCVSHDVQAVATHPGVVLYVATKAGADSSLFRVMVGTLTYVPDVLVKGKQINTDLLVKMCALTSVVARVDSLLGAHPPAVAEAEAVQEDSAPPPADAAEFERLLAPLRAGDTLVDYTALRMAYPRTPSYRPYPVRWEGTRAMFGALEARNFADVRRIADSILAVNFVDADAHLGAMAAAYKLGDGERAAFHGAVYRGLIASIGNRSGRTPDSAIVVLNIPEEYALLRARGLEMETVGLMNCGDRLCDRFELKQRGKRGRVVLYFDVSIPQAWGARHLRGR